jgi:phage baseplate assembly protein gpV
LILILLLAGGATALVGALGGVLGGFTGQVVTTHTYTVSEHPRLVITNNTGTVQVRAGSDARTISIQETKYTGVGADQQDVVVSYSQDSANNTVTANVTRTTSPNLFNVPRADFQVTVPASSDPSLTTNNENIDVSGISGHMVLNSNNGSITVKDGTLSTSSTLISNNGSVTFTGSIAASGAYTIESNTNSVHVNLPAEPGFRVDATADTGSISTNFPGLSVEHPSSTGAQLHGSVGASPTATLLLTSHTGSITLNQR